MWQAGLPFGTPGVFFTKDPPPPTHTQFCEQFCAFTAFVCPRQRNHQLHGPGRASGGGGGVHEVILLHHSSVHRPAAPNAQRNAGLRFCLSASIREPLILGAEGRRGSPHGGKRSGIHAGRTCTCGQGRRHRRADWGAGLGYP